MLIISKTRCKTSTFVIDLQDPAEIPYSRERLRVVGFPDVSNIIISNEGYIFEWSDLTPNKALFTFYFGILENFCQ